jgi:hypothetical protein
MAALTNTTIGVTRHGALKAAWRTERNLAKGARAAGDADGEWRHLERAHILSQPNVRLHVATHLAMLGAALRERNRHEIGGQLARLVLAAPGTVTGKYPRGNTGGANVSAFRPLPVPADLAAILDGRSR